MESPRWRHPRRSSREPLPAPPCPLPAGGPRRLPRLLPGGRRRLCPPLPGRVRMYRWSGCVFMWLPSHTAARRSPLPLSAQGPPLLPLSSSSCSSPPSSPILLFTPLPRSVKARGQVGERCPLISCSSNPRHQPLPFTTFWPHPLLPPSHPLPHPPSRWFDFYEFFSFFYFFNAFYSSPAVMTLPTPALCSRSREPGSRGSCPHHTAPQRSAAQSISEQRSAPSPPLHRGCSGWRHTQRSAGTQNAAAPAAASLAAPFPIIPPPVAASPPRSRQRPPRPGPAERPPRPPRPPRAAPGKAAGTAPPHQPLGGSSSAVSHPSTHPVGSHSSASP